MEMGSETLPVSLAELRAWLRLAEVAEENNLLTQVLRTAAEQCAQFIDQKLLLAACQEDIAADGYWHQLMHKPVRTITRVEWLDAEGAAQLLPVNSYEMTIDSEAIGYIRPAYAVSGKIRISYQAGLAASAEQLPSALRQGILRLAAYHYANRDGSEAPPAAVAALWQPFRRVHL